MVQRHDTEFALVFPETPGAADAADLGTVERRWPGTASPAPCRPGYQRRVPRPDGTTVCHEVTDAALTLWEQLQGEGAGLPPAFVDPPQLSPSPHVAVQSALQRHVDSAISKTINLPAAYSRHLITRAHGAGLKGITVFPLSGPAGEVLVPAPPEAAICEGPRCRER